MTRETRVAERQGKECRVLGAACRGHRPSSPCVAPWRLVLPVTLSVALGSCSGEARAGAEYTVRDSLGIEIVENISGSWTTETGWTLSREPAVDVGVLDGAPEYQLFRARDAQRLADGRIAVVNAGTNEIRLFDANGTYLKTVGRKGSGPGEFEGLGLLRLIPGDSLLAFDFALNRASVFDSEGNFGRSYSVVPSTGGGVGFAVDAFADGTLIIKAPQIFQGGFSEGLQRLDEDHYTISTSGEFLDSVGTFLGAEQYIETSRSGDNFSVFLSPRPFGRSTVLAARDEGFCFGSSDTYEIRCFASDGSLVQIIRRPLANRPVTAADVDDLKQQQLADTDDDNARRRIERLFSSVPIPETMPAYDGLEIDAGGNIWVREYSWADDAERHWTVFDASGRMLGDIALPPSFGIRQIGDDFVLGVWRDELDVEHVRLYHLVKPEGE